MEVRCFPKLLGISHRDHTASKKVRIRISGRMKTF